MNGVPHHGYRDGEVPSYRECARCGRVVRADRADLLAEHERVCANPLSATELRVLRMIADGSSNDDLARVFDVCDDTIRIRMRRIYRKLGIRAAGRGAAARAQAIAIAFRQRLID